MELPKTHEDAVKRQRELEEEYYSLYKKIVADYEDRLRKWNDDATKSIATMLRATARTEPVAEAAIDKSEREEDALANAAKVTVSNSEIISELVNSAAFQEVLAAVVKSAVNEIFSSVKKKDSE